MPEPSDNFEPTEADLDMMLEETTGKPIDKGSTAAIRPQRGLKLALLWLTEAALLEALVNEDFVHDLETVMKVKCAAPSALLKAIGLMGIPDVATSLEVTKRFGGDAVVNQPLR